MAPTGVSTDGTASKRGLVREVGGYTKEAPTVLNEWHAEVFPSEDSDDEIRQLCTAIISEAQFYQKHPYHH